MTVTAQPLAWLEDAGRDGSVHTVRVSFADRLGAWRGKRVPVATFLAGGGRPMGFCDGMIVCDVVCIVIEETPFTNFSTGYPDMHVHPDLSRVHPAAWSPGEAWVFGVPCDAHHEPLAVAPVNVLSRVTDRLASRGVTATVAASLGGRLMVEPGVAAGDADRERLLTDAADALVASDVPVAAWETGADPGAFRLRIGAAAPADTAEAVVVTKGALKELARRADLRAVFMTRPPGSSEPSRLELDLDLDGLHTAPDADRLAGLIGHARALLQPSVNAFKAGPPAAPAIAGRDRATSVLGVHASSEADPYTSVAAALAAAGEAAGDAPPERAAVASGLAEATGALRRHGWIGDWLGSPFVDNSAPLLEREAALFADAITDWETERYWSAG